jgi:hypothetical protein
LGLEYRGGSQETTPRSEKARERVQLNDEGYPLITAQNAATEVARIDLERSRG